MIIDFLTSFVSISSTVGVAIVIFLIKELFEIRRKREERTRKLDAAKILISEELERNHWAFISMFRVLKDIKYHDKEFPDAVFRLHIARDGSEHFRVKKDVNDTHESGQWIPKYNIEMYQRLLTSIAELDENIFINIQKAYDDISELIHYRQTLTDYLADEDLHDHESTKHFLIDFADKEKDYFIVLNGCYKTLNGNELTSFKLR